METQAFAEQFAKKFNLSPVIVEMIIQAIVALISNCPMNHEKLKSTIKNPNLWQRARATEIVMDRMPDYTRRQARQVAVDLIREAATLEDVRVDKVILECTDPSQW